MTNNERTERPMEKTLVGIFDDMELAQSARRELMKLGLDEDRIQMMSSDDAPPTRGDPSAHLGWMDKVRAWFSTLFDEGERARADEYTEAYRRGHTIVVADVDDDRTDAAASIMQRAGAIDIDRRSELWRRGGYEGFDASARPYTAEERERERASYEDGAENIAIPVVEEDVAIGKRLVQRGGVRIHSYVQERPVREQLRLREERVNVERRPADRPATAEDQAFQERTVDVTAMGEEAVVGKTARVVEEVVVSKSAEERTETVDERAKRKDVDVRPIDPRSQPAPKR